MSGGTVKKAVISVMEQETAMVMKTAKVEKMVAVLAVKAVRYHFLIFKLENIY